ncbi:MAG: DUF4160 domain-containing protein [Methyloceanibacter sp.]
MPTVLRWGRYRTLFYSNEGDEPPHVHVRSGNREAKVWLSDLTVAVNFRFPAHELSDIIRHLETHSEELLEAWNDYFGD